MALFADKKEIENVYLNGMQLDHIYVNGTMVYESTIYVDKPIISGVYTYNGLKQTVAMTGYNAEAMTIGGTYEATEAGAYTVTFTPKKGYAWADETITPLEYTWTIKKLTLAVPTLSMTWFAWVEGNAHRVAVNGMNATFISQSGDLAQTDTSSNIGASHTVTWALKNSASCVWPDGTNGNKTATWRVEWSNGTSHYKNDVYNSGWGLGNITPNSDCIAGYRTNNGMIEILSNSSGVVVIRTNVGYNAGCVAHMIVRVHSSASAAILTACDSWWSNPSVVEVPGYNYLTRSVDWAEIAGAMGDSYTGYYFALSIGDTDGADIKRIWIE